MVKLLSTLFFSLLFFNAYALDWKLTDQNDDWLTYVDASSLTRNGDLVTFWMLGNYMKPQKFGSGFFNKKVVFSITSLMTFNCKKETYFFKQIIHHSGKFGTGDMVNKDIIDKPEWFPIEPYSVFRRTMTKVC